MKLGCGTKKKMPWGILLIAFIFLFNPNFSLIDPLPDFIGYALISLFLSKLSMLNDIIWEARRAFENMIAIDCGRILAIVWVFGMEAISERSTSILVWTFVFAVLEGIFLVPAYIKLFKGISEIGDFYPNTTIHTKSGKSRFSSTEKIRNLTIFFVFFKATLAVLPELSVLSNSSNDAAEYNNSLYRYIGVMRGLCIVPVLIVGIYWLVKVIEYFRHLSVDTELNEAIIEKYNAKQITQKGIFIKKNIKTACLFLTVAAVLSLDFRLEDINVIPDILLPAAIIPAVVFLCKTTELKKKIIYVFTAIYGVLSAAAFVAERYYLESYTYNAMQRVPEAFNAYLSWVIIVALQGISFVLLFVFIFKAMKTVIDAHTGYVLGKEIHSEREAVHINALREELKKGFELAFDFAILYVISDVFYSLYGAIYAFMNKNFGFLNVVNLGCGLLFIGMLLRAMGDMREAVNTKYMLE